ncbi:unnamed protein product [Musa textilis]
MFKAARWRATEKNKNKAVFKLQFQATQVPQSGPGTMMVSLGPVGASRPTARSEKVAVIGGTCNWVNPVYETVKLVRNPTTGKMDDKVYRFLLSATGSSRAGVLGDVAVNLADYAEVFNAASVSLPLKASNTGTILHIAIQRIQGGGRAREGDEDGEVMIKRQTRALQSQLKQCDFKEGVKAPNDMDCFSFMSDGSYVNIHSQVKFPSSRGIPIRVDSHGSLQKSHSFDTISASDSDTSSGIYATRDNWIKHNNAQRDPTSFFSSLIGSDTPRRLITSSGDWSRTSAPDGNADASTRSSGDVVLNETSCDSEDSIEKLRYDIVMLTRKVELSDLELQILRKQIIKESKRGEDLSRELSSLKEERDALKRECEALKLSEKPIQFEGNIPTGSQHDGDDLHSLLEKTKQELDHEKNLNVHLRLQLKMMQGSELILAVKDLDTLLEQRNREPLCMKCSKMYLKTETGDELEAMKLGNGLPQLKKYEYEQKLHKKVAQNDNEEQYALDELVNIHDDMKVAYSLENKIVDLNNEVEFYMKDHEDLEMQMEQLALDYEILKQENHDITTKLEQIQLREQLRMQYECSAHVAIISDLESHVECLEKELHKQAESFEADIATITDAKVEQEKRAILAEEALREAKWSNSKIVKRLQEEFRSLSAHMSSTFQANEKIVKHVLKETAELRSEKSNLEDLLDKTKKDMVSVQEQFRMKFKQLVDLLYFKSKEADRLLLELKDTQREFENYKMSEVASRKNFVEEMQLITEMEKLKLEKSLLSEQNKEKDELLVEMDLSRAATEVTEISLQDKNLEIDMLKKEIAVLRKEVNISLEEKNDLRNIKDEKDTTVSVLKSEVANPGVQYSNLKHTLSEYELEKQDLRISFSNLKGGLLEKQLTTSSDEKNGDNHTASISNDDEHFHQSLRYGSKDDAKCNRDYLQQSEDENHTHDIDSKDNKLRVRYAGNDLGEVHQVFISSTFDEKKIAELSEMTVLEK